jgi:hypothetical protein
MARARVDGSRQSPEYVFGMMAALGWVLASRPESPVTKDYSEFPPTLRDMENEADLAREYGSEQLGQTKARRDFCRGAAAALDWALGKTRTPPYR